MTPDEFRFFVNLLKERSGITLSDDKEYLIESRLLPVARHRNLQTVSELCTHVRLKPSEDLLVEITEAMTTNESSFFRDNKPYEQLRQAILPAVMKAKGAQKKLRIWSAACSTGQEPYSIAICLREETAKLQGWSFEIVASDLAGKVVGRAQAGVYSQFEVQRGLPIQMLIKYFSPLPDTTWRLNDDIRSMVQYQKRNLLSDFSALGKFDIIFCRNVFIYFDEATRGLICKKMERALEPHGVLVLGATETLVDVDKHFVALHNLRGAYHRRP